MPIPKKDPSDATEPQLYKMHLYVAGAWRELGVTDIDLTNYWSKDDFDFAADADIDALLDDVFGD